MSATQQQTTLLGKKWLLAALIFSSSFSLALPANAQAKNPELQVGIIQRLGEKDDNKDNDWITLSSSEGNLLTLTFSDRSGKEQKIETKQLKLEIVQQAQQKPTYLERVILSDHATFETAEDSAKQWQAQGIEVEITQPGRWQVWAKRAVYKTPLLRRLLLESLRMQGHTQPFIETEISATKTQPTFRVNGKRFYQDNLEISADNNTIRVKLGEKNPSRTYGGKLKLQPNAYGSFTLVNQVPLETYLRGVVPHEIGRDAPDNAVKAQTIIARTYALRNLRRFQADNYELCADVHCQVYYGLSETEPRADSAIAETKGLVLTYQNELIDALYSSTTGGVTARFSDTWNGVERPYLQPVIDAPNQVWNLSQQSLANEDSFRRFISLKQGFNETPQKLFRWNRKGTLKELNDDLREYLQKRKDPMADFQTIERLDIVERSPSGRVLKLVIQTNKGRLELQKNEIRSCFSTPRSTLFYLEPMYDEKQLKGYVFIGGGFGHGVGLSQFGSYNLANLGWSADKILAFYYPGTTLKLLDDSVVLWRDPLAEK
jgi:SpoIID/LytB domain protein